jgi:DNA-binding transcriptional MerR regulator
LTLPLEEPLFFVRGGDEWLLYTVKELSAISQVTIKTLHHYHKIGLLLPEKVSQAGYRLYGRGEVERLQAILFYRELEIPLLQIKQLLERDVDRLRILTEQRTMLRKKATRLGQILGTLEKSIEAVQGGVTMGKQEMFAGFSSEEEWKSALQEQKEYLQETYEAELDTSTIDVQEMNEQAREAVFFMTELADALRAGVKHFDERIKEKIQTHVAFLNQHGHTMTAVDFANQTAFFLQDDFHLAMLEAQQTGLAYYLSAAAQVFAADPLTQS